RDCGKTSTSRDLDEKLGRAVLDGMCLAWRPRASTPSSGTQRLATADGISRVYRFSRNSLESVEHRARGGGGILQRHARWLVDLRVRGRTASAGARAGRMGAAFRA